MTTTTPQLETIPGKDLLTRPIEPLGFTITGILPHGLFILAGSPKVGKSWLALDVCHAVATGGDLWQYPAAQGDVLYLALEDNPARLQEADKKGMSWKTLLRRTIDAAIRSSGTFDEFRFFMREAGYEIKHGKHISFRAVGQERFTRAKTIGDHYSEEHIRERIAEPKKLPSLSSKQFSPTIRRMIDRNSEKIKANSGYRHWATLHNLKSMSETLTYLQEKCNGDLGKFERRYDDCAALQCANAS
jgi:hypothetical protein